MDMARKIFSLALSVLTKFGHILKSMKTRHSGESRSPEPFIKTGFRLLSAFGGLAGMTQTMSVQHFKKTSK